MRRDSKTINRAGRYRHALRIERNVRATNELREPVDNWTVVDTVMGSVEPFGGYEGKAQGSRRETELVNVFMRANGDIEDMGAEDYRLVWEVAEDENGISIPAREKILGIQTFRDIMGKDRLWAFVCMVAINRESS